MPESTITTKGQTTLPKEIRGALKLSTGDRIRYIVLDSGTVQLLRVGSAMRLNGMLSSTCQSPVTLEEMDRAIAKCATE